MCVCHLCACNMMSWGDMVGEEEIAFVTRIQDLSRSKLLFWLNSFLVQFMLCIAEALLCIPQIIKNQIISF